MNTKVKIACFCGSSIGILLRNSIRGGKEQPIARCSKCGVVSKTNLDKHHHEQFHREGRQAWEINLNSMSEEYAKRNLTDVVARIDAIRPIIDETQCLLDFGTGMGHFMNAVSDHVDTVVGVDINEKRVHFVRSELQLDVYEDISRLRKDAVYRSIDVVTMFHVLEHLPNPVEQLRNIHDLLTTDSYLIVEVPNHDDWMLSMSHAYADFYYQDAHAYYYHKHSLTKVLDMAGFEAEIRHIQRYGYRNAIHWLVKRKPQLNSPSRHRDHWGTPLDKIYANVMGALNKSDTIFALCRPRYSKILCTKKG